MLSHTATAPGGCTRGWSTMVFLSGAANPDAVKKKKPRRLGCTDVRWWLASRSLAFFPSPSRAPPHWAPRAASAEVTSPSVSPLRTCSSTSPRSISSPLEASAAAAAAAARAAAPTASLPGEAGLSSYFGEAGRSI
eukprot:scaffold50558_cov30-Tisochrysis_lutea.AAC.10